MIPSKPTSTFALLAAAFAPLALADVALPGVPSGCMTSRGGISFGWLPDDNLNYDTMAAVNADTGKPGCFFGDYSHIKSPSYDGSDISAKGPVAHGAVIVPSIMPTGVTWDQVDDTVTTAIGNVVRKFSSQGLTTYLRFAHEMNCYAKPGCPPDNPYPGGQDYSSFQQAWQRVAKVCKAIDGCYMYWCPNLQDLDSLSNWWPGEDYVDIVGVDHYPKPSQVGASFADNYGDFYSQFVAKYNKPFLLGETASNDPSWDTKNQWAKTVTVGDFSSFPLYKGAMWFEYVTGGSDFYIVLNQSVTNRNTFLESFR